MVTSKCDLKWTTATEIVFGRMFPRPKPLPSERVAGKH